MCGGVNARGGTERRAHDKKRRRWGGGDRRQAAGLTGDDNGASLCSGIGAFVYGLFAPYFFGVNSIGALQQYVNGVGRFVLFALCTLFCLEHLLVVGK